MDLPLKQQDFCLHYAIGEKKTISNGTQSAAAAGYSKNSSAQQASYLLQQPKVQAVIKALKEMGQKMTQITFKDYVRLLMQQANSWLDETGNPIETPLVSHGGVVTVEVVARDDDGNLIMKDDGSGEPVTIKRPIIERARPNAANVRAAELIGKALGYLDMEDAPGKGAKLGGVGNKRDVSLPEKGYKELKPGQLSAFLDKLPH